MNQSELRVRVQHLRGAGMLRQATSPICGLLFKPFHSVS